MANIESVTLSDPRFGHVVVTAHNDRVLGDDEWEQNHLSYVREIRAKGDPERCACLVFAEGNGPNAQQRAAGNEIFGKDVKYEFRVAVVTNSLMVRGAVSAFSWFNPLIRAFGPEAWREAMWQVRMDVSHDRLMLDALRELRGRLGSTKVLDQCLLAMEKDLKAK